MSHLIQNPCVQHVSTRLVHKRLVIQKFHAISKYSLVTHFNGKHTFRNQSRRCVVAVSLFMMNLKQQELGLIRLKHVDSIRVMASGTVVVLDI